MHQYIVGALLIALPLTQVSCPPNDDDDDTTVPDSPTPGSPTPGSPTPVIDPTPSEYGIPERIPNTTCKVEGVPGAPSTMALDRAFDALSFTSPVHLTHAGDGSNRLFVVEQPGQIKLFNNDEAATTSSTFLDIRSRVATNGSEMGLLGLAFHPDYERNGYFYVNYTAGNPTRTVVSRFKVSSDPGRADSASELVLLEIGQPYTNHNGGMVTFGPDGDLYIGMGDGGSGGDPQGNGQNIKVLLGKMLRIDVDHPENGLNYGIPDDNPFANTTDGSRPEIYAWGVRNPWRFSFDRVTGQLWAGDVGQDKYEEIDIIERGGNYGWNTMEGFHCYNTTSCVQEGLKLPVLEYDHSQGVSVTGGYVYRGTRLPSLYGYYVYADYSVGRIWATRAVNGQSQEQLQLLDSTEYISSFGEDEAGEMYVVSYGGKIFHLVPASGGSAGTFPTRLSETGCFSDVAGRVPAPGVIGYDVNSPLWSDGTKKDRFFALPGTSQMEFDPEHAWTLPEGSITFKDFYVEEEAGNPASKRLLETRLMVRQGEMWNGYTYKWNDTQTDAYLLEGAVTESYTLTAEDGSSYEYSHYYPSRFDCQGCHTPASGYVLGLRTGQMNRDHAYATAVDNQLRAFDHAGLFTEAVSEPYDQYAVYPDPADHAVPLALRARSYLQANCAHCHLPGGTAVSSLDLRYEVPLEETRACNVAPTQGDLGIPGALIIDAGDPSNSVLALRMHSLDETVRMPNLASLRVDEVGTQVVDQWISELAGCP